MGEQHDQPDDGDKPEAATLSAADAMSLISPPGAGDDRPSEPEEEEEPPAA